MTDTPDIADLAPRLGPRQLALHLGLATTTIASSLAGIPLPPEFDPIATAGGTGGQSEDIATTLRRHASPEVLQALCDQGSEMVQEMINGINMYHRHPYRRNDRARPALWSEGTTRLLDCSPGANEQAPVLVIVPSLVNRSYVLDLMPGRSLVDYLADEGIRPLLLDWDLPGKAEREFGLADYINQRISVALEYVMAEFPSQPLHLAGYCMGGTLAVAVAEKYQSRLASFIALASPWDFHSGLAAQAKMLLEQKELWAVVLDGFGELPVDLLQTLFTSLDPDLGLRKFSMFSKMDMASERAIEFVALEDWLNDGMPLARKVAEECFRKWYTENVTHEGCWRAGDQIISPQNISIPALIAVPKADKIVPGPSARALGARIPNSKIITPPSGHIGMITSRRARDGLWQELSDWILSC